MSFTAAQKSSQGQGNREDGFAKPSWSSYNVFMDFVGADGDATNILSSACFQKWVSTRKSKLKQPEESFRRVLTAHVCGLVGRKPFPAKVESSLLESLRRKEVWGCFDDPTVTIGIKGFRKAGFHESRRGIFGKRAVSSNLSPRGANNPENVVLNHNLAKNNGPIRNFARSARNNSAVYSDSQKTVESPSAELEGFNLQNNSPHFFAYPQNPYHTQQTSHHNTNQFQPIDYDPAQHPDLMINPDQYNSAPRADFSRQVSIESETISGMKRGFEPIDPLNIFQSSPSGFLPSLMPMTKRFKYISSPAENEQMMFGTNLFSLGTTPVNQNFLKTFQDIQVNNLNQNYVAPLPNHQQQ